jgi:hypothetical protein
MYVVWARVCDRAPVPRSRRHSGRRAPPIPPATIRHHAGAGGADHRAPSPARRPSRGETRLMARTAPPSLRPMRGGRHTFPEGIPSRPPCQGLPGLARKLPGLWAAMTGVAGGACASRIVLASGRRQRRTPRSAQSRSRNCSSPTVRPGALLIRRTPSRTPAMNDSRCIESCRIARVSPTSPNSTS